MPEGRGVFFGLTVAEHFRLGFPGERLDADIAYGYFPALARIADRRAGLLSGGEQQMLALGRALARKPRLLAARRAVSSASRRSSSRACCRSCRASPPRAAARVLLVEQHIHIALAVADRGYVLAHGELIIHERAEVLRADHELILSGYLGEQAHQQPAAGD